MKNRDVWGKAREVRLVREAQSAEATRIFGGYIAQTRVGSQGGSPKAFTRWLADKSDFAQVTDFEEVSK